MWTRAAALAACALFVLSALAVATASTTGPTVTPQPSTLGIVASMNFSQGLTLGSPAFDSANGTMFVPTGRGVVLTANGTSPEAWFNASPSIPYVGYRAAVYDPSNGYVYAVSDTHAGFVTVLRGTAPVANVSVCPEPIGQVLDARTGWLYVECDGLGIDFATAPSVAVLSNTTLIANLTVAPVASSPAPLVYDAADGFVYAPGTAGLVVLNGTAYAGNLTGVPSYGGGAYDPADGDVYLGQGLDVAVVNGTHLAAVLVQNIWSLIRAIVYDPADGEIYAASSGLYVYGFANLTEEFFTTAPPNISSGVYDAATQEVVFESAGAYPTFDTSLVVYKGSTNEGTVAVGDGNPFYLTYDPSTGDLIADGGDPSVLALSRAVTHELIVRETGILPGAVWNATVGSVVLQETGTSAVFNEMPGLYRWSVSASGYRVAHTTGLARVGARNVGVAVTFRALYSATVLETGLPNGTAWSVRIAGVWYVSTGQIVSTNLTNGVYGVPARAVAGYTVRASGPLRVHNGPATVTVTFTPRPPPK